MSPSPRKLQMVVTWYSYGWGDISTSHISHAGRTAPLRLSATTYSIYSQLPSILQAVSPSATWWWAMLLWQGPTYNVIYRYNLFLHSKTALIKKQLNSRYIHITLHSDIKHVTCC